MFSYIEYQYPIAYLFHKELLWVNKNCNVYFAFKLLESDDWTFFAGNVSHALATGELLTSYGTSESQAATNYLTTTRDSNGKVLAVLPSNFQAKYARVYIETGNDVTIHEWTPSVYLTANEIIAGELLITDKLSDAPLIKVQSDGVDRIKLGKVGQYHGLFGYDSFGNKIFELSDDLQEIGGWEFTDSVLKSVTSGEGITLDAANQKIESEGYVSGAMGNGFHIDPNLIEIGNINARGTLKCSVFQKQTANAVGGDLLVAESDVLDEDMTALDASTLTIKGDVNFAVGDVLRIKADESNDEWIQVTNIASAPTYIVTRDKAGSFAANNNPEWKKGSAVINYGLSGESGLIYMTASDTNAPYLAVISHSGAPWSTLHTRLRIGNLNGYLGYSSDAYGIGIGGIASGESNLVYDPANGLRLRTTTVDKITLDNYGNVWISDKLTLGRTNVSSGRLILEMKDSGGDTYIAAGKTDFNNSESGFILGIDDSDSNKTKFYLGNSTNYLNWEGTSLSIKGDITATSGYFQSVTLGKTGVVSGTLTLQLNDGGGDTYIAAGKTDFNNTDTGFIIGLDDSDSDKAKFYIGNTTHYLNWDGSTLLFVGDLKTGTSGERLEFLTSDNKLHFYNSAGDEVVTLGNITPSATDLMYLRIVESFVTLGTRRTYGVYVDVLNYSNASSYDIINYGLHGSMRNARGTGLYNVINYGVYGIADNGQFNYGGYFKGGTGPVVLYPSTSSSAPSHTAYKGTLWVTSAGVLYINTNGSTTWAKVGAQ